MEKLPEPNRIAGLGRLASFVAQSLSQYSKARNFDFGPQRRSNVSLLSPYVRHRLILEQEILEVTLRHQSLHDASKFVQEIFWRSYFKGWMEHRPDAWSDYRANVSRLISELEADSELLRRYTSAITGQTGIDCFDAWTKELEQTGYLHNHARMWFASIWIFTLRLPWQLGADFFYRHLIDGDPASNTLSWRWVAGLHTKGKNYLALSSNIARYSDNRFNPANKLATTALPLTETRVFPLRELPNTQTLPADSRYGLLITEEDCSPETLALPQRPKSILGAVATQQRSPFPVGTHAEDFATGAVSDALRRATQHFAVDGQLAKTGDWINLLLDWTAQNQLTTIATACAPTGPVAELLTASKLHLEKHGVQLFQLRRPYDSKIWPLASRGYFKLKEKIPGLLDQLGVFGFDERADTRSEAV